MLCGGGIDLHAADGIDRGLIGMIATATGMRRCAMRVTVMTVICVCHLKTLSPAAGRPLIYIP
jgi:hypothetical protein